MCIWNPWKTVPRDGSPIIVLLPNNRAFDCRYDTEQWVGFDRAVVIFKEHERGGRQGPLGWIPWPASA